MTESQLSDHGDISGKVNLPTGSVKLILDLGALSACLAAKEVDRNQVSSKLASAHQICLVANFYLSYSPFTGYGSRTSKCRHVDRSPRCEPFTIVRACELQKRQE